LKRHQMNIEGEGWGCGGREGKTDIGERDAKDDISFFSDRRFCP